MSKTILNHGDHQYMIAEKRGPFEAENGVCIRLGARFGVGKARVYEIRHGIHMPACCSMSAPALIAGQPGRKSKNIVSVKVAPVASDLPIVAFRMWNYVGGSEGRLASYAQSLGTGMWKPFEKFTAHCGNGRHVGDQIPAAVDCCGVHAYKNVNAADLLARQSEGILGVVMLFGKVQEHEIGYRAQFAKIVALTVKPTDPKAFGVDTFEIRAKRTAIISNEYGIPVIPFEHINSYISEFGQVLPCVTPSGRRKRG
jgi:hypothetical protein